MHRFCYCVQAAVSAAKDGEHERALELYDQLFAQVAKQHLTHPELFVTYANRAASHLAVGQYAEALQVNACCLPEVPLHLIMHVTVEPLDNHQPVQIQHRGIVVTHALILLLWNTAEALRQNATSSVPATFCQLCLPCGCAWRRPQALAALSKGCQCNAEVENCTRSCGFSCIWQISHQHILVLLFFSSSL